MPTEEALRAFMGMPEWARDQVRINVEAHLDWKDRLHLLFSGQLWVRASVNLEHPAGRNEPNESRIEIVKARWPWSRPLKDVAVEPEQPS